MLTQIPSFISDTHFLRKILLSDKKPSTCSHSSPRIEMGCGASTLIPDNGDIQAKVRPMLKRRIDDLKRRRTLLKDSTPSKKELLTGEDYDKTSTNNDSLGSKSVLSEDSSDHGVAKIVPVAEEEEEEEEAKINEECATKKDEKREEEEVHDREKTGDAEETEQEGRRGGPEAEMQENDEDDDDDDGRCISPGSPSFRFYCVESVPREIDQEHESRVESPKQDSETKALEQQQHSDSQTRNPKGKINRKFRTVIHKGQVKSLLKVKSCYNPACSGGAHDKGHLLQETAA